MNINDEFPSKWLKASDLKGRQHTVHIDSVDRETFTDGTAKPVLSFEGKEKGMVLNKTNAMAIAEVYGPETNGWIGKPIVIFSMKVQGPNGPTDGIRCMVPEDAPEPPKNPQPVGMETAGADLDDDIPGF